MISRQHLFSILKNLVDEDYSSGKRYSGEPISIILMDSNDNVNDDIQLEQLKNDDELQLVVKFVNTDIDESHTWVEQLITQVELENNCEIIDEGDYEENTITAVFVLDDFALEDFKENSKEDFVLNDSSKNCVNDNLSKKDLLKKDLVKKDFADDFSEKNTNKEDIAQNDAINNLFASDEEDTASTIEEEINKQIDMNMEQNEAYVDNDKDYDEDYEKEDNDKDYKDIDEEEEEDYKDYGKNEKKEINAGDLLKKIDPITGQMIINTNDINNNDIHNNDINANDTDTDVNNVNNNNTNNIDVNDVNNNDTNNTDTNANIDKVVVKNITRELKQKKKDVTRVRSNVTVKINPNININDMTHADKILNNLGISIIGSASNRVSAKTADGRTMSAAAQVMEMLNEITAKNSMTNAVLTELQDVLICKQEMKLSYPLLMKVNPSLEYKDQASFAGKKRYGKRIITYCGQDFYITNHIFANNINKIRLYLENKGLIDKVEGLMIENKTSAKQKMIQDLINQKTNIKING